MGQVPGAVDRQPAVTGALPPVLPGDLGLEPAVRWDAWRALAPDEAAALLALRGRPAPDAADTAAATRHAWVDDTSGAVAALRVRPDGAALRLEGLVVRDDVRALGLGGALLVAAVARAGGRALVADVPPEAAALFERLDFAAADGIVDLGGGTALVRMRRAPDTPWRE